MWGNHASYEGKTQSLPAGLSWITSSLPCKYQLAASQKFFIQPDCSYDHKDYWEITIKNALNPICPTKISQISKRTQTVTVVRV